MKRLLLVLMAVLLTAGCQSQDTLSTLTQRELVIREAFLMWSAKDIDHMCVEYAADPDLIWHIFNRGSRAAFSRDEFESAADSLCQD